LDKLWKNITPLLFLCFASIVFAIWLWCWVGGEMGSMLALCMIFFVFLPCILLNFIFKIVFKDKSTNLILQFFILAFFIAIIIMGILRKCNVI